MKYRVRINQEKLEELKKELKPGHSWWALAGIIIFFFIPEIAAFFWGDEITKYFALKEQHSSDYLHKLLYRKLKSLGENSILNLALGIGFLIWFFKGRKEHKEKDIKPPEIKL